RRTCGLRPRVLIRRSLIRRSSAPAVRSALWFFISRNFLADLLQGSSDETRDVHLRDADLLRDLRLRQPFEEAQVEDRPLAVVEHAKAGLEQRAVLRDLVLVLDLAERLERIELLAVLLAAALRQREGRVRAAGLERLEHFFLFDACGLRELGDRRRAAELNGQLLDQLREADVQLLEPARHAHSPAAVAEMALDLADDVRRRVRRELDAAREVEAVDRLDQPDRPDLHEVVQLLAAIGVAPRERADERHVLLDQLLAGLQVALLVVATQEDLVVLSHAVPPSSRAGPGRRPPRRRPQPPAGSGAGSGSRRPPRRRALRSGRPARRRSRACRRRATSRRSPRRRPWRGRGSSRARAEGPRASRSSARGGRRARRGRGGRLGGTR